MAKKQQQNDVVNLGNVTLEAPKPELQVVVPEVAMVIGDKVDFTEIILKPSAVPQVEPAPLPTVIREDF